MEKNNHLSVAIVGAGLSGSLLAINLLKNTFDGKIDGASRARKSDDVCSGGGGTAENCVVLAALQIYHHQRNYLQRALDQYGPDTPYRTTTGISYFESVTLRALEGAGGQGEVLRAVEQSRLRG